MSDSSLAAMVNNIVDASKPIVKLVAIVEGAVISVVTDDKEAIPTLLQGVDKLYEEVKK